MRNRTVKKPAGEYMLEVCKTGLLHGNILFPYDFFPNPVFLTEILVEYENRKEQHN